MKTTPFRYKVMIHSLITMAVCLSLNTATAQTNKEVVSDTVEISVGRKTVSIVTDSSGEGKSVRLISERNTPSSESSTQWDMSDNDGDKKKKKRKTIEVGFLNIDLGANFLTFDQSFNVPVEYDALDIKPANSTNVGLHVLTTRLNIARGHLGLVSAITFDNNRYAFRDNITLVPGMDSVTVTADPESYRKHKLITWYGQIPLLLSFQTNPDRDGRNFHFAVGGYAGLFLGAQTKKKYGNGDKVKVNDDYNLERFRYGAMARIGFGGLELYAKYDLSPMFAEGQGPEIHPFTFGISLTGMM